MDPQIEKVVAKKSLGQHFLTSDYVPKQMANAAKLIAGDVVVEIGPGTGVLTKELLSREVRVIAIETDDRSVEALKKTFAEAIQSGQLRIVEADIRSLSIESIGIAAGEYKVVANIPYYLSGQLFRYFLDTTIQPSTLVYLVQKEVASRIARDPKESLLSLSVKVFGDPKYIQTIARGHFVPPPKVDSAIIAVHDISQTRLQGIDPSFFFDVLHLGFAAKRKQLFGNLRKQFSKDTLTHTFSTLDIPETIRGEDLTIEMWCKLVHTLTIHT